MKPKTKRIVVVEDHSSLAEDIRRSFESESNEYQLELVTTVADAIKAISRKAPDLVLSEQTLSDGTYHDILKISCDAWPIVVMVSFGKEQCAVEAVKSGALDYIVKSSGSVWNLPHVIKHSLGEWQILRERKQLTNMLRVSEERYLTLFEHASDGILHLSPNGKILRVNESFARMHGYSVKELLNAKIHDFSPNTSMKSLNEKLKALPEGEELNFELENRHKDGHKLPFIASVCLISRESKPYLVAFHRDTRELRQDIVAQDENKPWEQIFDHVSDLMFIVDDDYTITHINHTMANHLGHCKQEVTGRRCHEVIHGLSSPPDYCPHTKKILEKKDQVSEIKEPELNGKYKHMSIMPIRQFNGVRNSLVHVVKIDSEFFQKYVLPITSFA
jgi:PAS domain S-box-containing protein